MAHSSWGPGWPNCQPGKIKTDFSVSGTRFPGGVRFELVDLFTMLIQETKNRGYRFGTASDPSYGCWGFGCRPISGTQTASNHSWGLAVDINAPSNPYTSPLKTDMPGWMPDLWNEYGFRWGGDYNGRKDAMHYEFMGSVAEAAAQTAKARSRGLGGAVPQPPGGGGGGGGGGQPEPLPPIPSEDDEIMRLIKANSGNGAIFAYSPGRFFHVPGQSHLDLGTRLGLWDGKITTVSPGDLDVMRDNCCGNAKEEGPNSKGVNIITGLPSNIAK